MKHFVQFALEPNFINECQICNKIQNLCPTDATNLHMLARLIFWTSGKYKVYLCLY